jgi:hypothetical protein
VHNSGVRPKSRLTGDKFDSVGRIPTFRGKRCSVPERDKHFTRIVRLSGTDKILENYVGLHPTLLNRSPVKRQKQLNLLMSTEPRICQFSSVFSVKTLSYFYLQTASQMRSFQVCVNLSFNFRSCLINSKEVGINPQKYTKLKGFYIVSYIFAA